ncbi:MAG: hypothetical protein JWM78_403 [Verrucomicrobiaceae bacterium]|nr:hypothetical protein [Verrucomicrobiaceae bacterium]
MHEHTLELFAHADHPAFAGHFPGMPIVPGVVLLDWAVAAIEAAQGRALFPGQLSVAKFLMPVPPGAQLFLHYRIDATNKITFRIEFETRLVASGVFLSHNTVSKLPPAPEQSA